MLLQLTSVLNYFTCDLRYFLRKSVRYLLKDNKINLACCPFTFLSVVLSLFPFSVPLYCVPHTVVLLSVADLVLLIMLMCFAFFFLIRRQFPSIHMKCCGSDSKQVGSVWAAGGLPLPLSPYPIDFLLCSSFFFSIIWHPVFFLSLPINAFSGLEKITFFHSVWQYHIYSVLACSSSSLKRYNVYIEPSFSLQYLVSLETWWDLHYSLNEGYMGLKV